MKASQVLWPLVRFLLFPSVVFPVLLYSYPLVFGCGFPKAVSQVQQCYFDKPPDLPPPRKAPFRLLALGDPQLEGDSSLPDPNAPLFPSLQHFFHSTDSDYSRGFQTEETSITSALKDFYSHDILKVLKTWRKQLDLFGNDYFLAHIYRMIHWWLEPTHVVVLGDLLGSQWINDEEFERRGSRFWKRTFNGGRRVEDDITAQEHEVEELGSDEEWKMRVINVAGNHDIGYAGDITRERVQRFERMFGKVNWDLRFTLPNTTAAAASPELRLVILNDMNLDVPAYDTDLAMETYSFLNDEVIAKSRPVDDKTAATIVLTHIPVNKAENVCIDGPLFDYGATGIREQNHLSERSSRAILEGVFGVHRTQESPSRQLGRNGVILTGHDHEGCDVYHHLASEEGSPDQNQWEQRRWRDATQLIDDESIAGVREITVRSMMGSFGGTAGLLSAWFDDEVGEWRFEYSTCFVGVQHMWWAVHVFDLVTLAVLLSALTATCAEWMLDQGSKSSSKLTHGPGQNPVQGVKDIGNKVFADASGSATSSNISNGEQVKRRRG